ncbi:MAG: DUF488 family protein [Gammaproteobacteria bacterium]|nr:DUF488 family protein [Gammaproteobacteria bacterium]
MPSEPKPRSPPRIAVKRVYSPPAVDDGCRILVDRLWPRGLKKDAAKIDHWQREAAPSDALRRWFDHDPAKWDEFCRRYFAELGASAAALAPLRERLRQARKVTLLFSAKDEAHNNAIALAQYLHAHRAAVRRYRRD